jgi:nucleotide-binding universal stress UspA family protein
MFRKILVPLDGSPLAQEVLDQVKTLARMDGAEICLMRAVLVHTFPGTDPTKRQVEVVREAETYLQGLQKSLEEEGFRVSSHVCYGHEVEEILEDAHLLDVDLVAMATHGRTGLARWAMGSISEQVVRHSDKPVLLLNVERAKAA